MGNQIRPAYLCTFDLLDLQWVNKWKAEASIADKIRGFASVQEQY